MTEERIDRFIVWLSRQHPDRALPSRHVAREVLENTLKKKEDEDGTDSENQTG